MGKTYEVSVPFMCTVTVEVEIDDDMIDEALERVGDINDEDVKNDAIIEMVKELACDNVDVQSFCGNGGIDKLIGVYEGSIEPDGVNYDEEFHVREI